VTDADGSGDSFTTGVVAVKSQYLMSYRDFETALVRLSLSSTALDSLDFKGSVSRLGRLVEQLYLKPMPKEDQKREQAFKDKKEEARLKSVLALRPLGGGGQGGLHHTTSMASLGSGGAPAGPGRPFPPIAGLQRSMTAPFL